MLIVSVDEAASALALINPPPAKAPVSALINDLRVCAMFYGFMMVLVNSIVCSNRFESRKRGVAALCSRTMDDADIIVVGAGIVGCATAAHLAEEGQDVLVLEAGDFPNPMATSYGSGRNFRFAYHEGGTYVPLLKRSRERWLALDDSTSETLFTNTGSLTIGQSDGDTFSGALGTCALTPLHACDWRV